jgi:hypothetical protein
MLEPKPAAVNGQSASLPHSRDDELLAQQLGSYGPSGLNCVKLVVQGCHGGSRSQGGREWACVVLHSGSPFPYCSPSGGRAAAPGTSPDVTSVTSVTPAMQRPAHVKPARNRIGLAGSLSHCINLPSLTCLETSSQPHPALHFSASTL